eukprot:751655-Hanusia_phi.AAC.2
MLTCGPNLVRFVRRQAGARLGKEKDEDEDEEEEGMSGIQRYELQKQKTRETRIKLLLAKITTNNSGPTQFYKVTSSLSSSACCLLPLCPPANPTHAPAPPRPRPRLSHTPISFRSYSSIVTSGMLCLANLLVLTYVCRLLLSWRQKESTPATWSSSRRGSRKGWSTSSSSPDDRRGSDDAFLIISLYLPVQDSIPSLER